MTTRPPTRALLWSGFGALVGLWLSFAVVAGMTQSTAPRRAAHAAAPPKAAPVGLAISTAPALHVRATVFGAAPAVAIAAPKPTHRHRAAPKPAAPAPAPAPAPAMSAPASPAAQAPITTPATPAPTTPVQQAPAPRPVRKAQPTLVAKPKPSSGPGFDESAPSGFDNSG